MVMPEQPVVTLLNFAQLKPQTVNYIIDVENVYSMSIMLHYNFKIWFKMF